MIQNALLVVLVYWVCFAIDNLLAWETMQRPIIAGPLIGLALGDLHTGIVMGASLEAIFMGVVAIGGVVPSDSLSATVITVAFTIATGTDIATGLAIAMPIGTIMIAVRSMLTPIHAAFAPHWENLAAKGNIRNFKIQTFLYSLLIGPLTNCIIIFVSVGYGIAGLQTLLASLPTWVMLGMKASSGMMVGVGFAILTSMIWNNQLGGFFLVGFVLVKYLNLEPLPIAIFATVVALMYFFNDKKIMDANKKSTKKIDSTGGEDFF